MALHPDRDVILLNSDTEVANDWIDRMVRTAYSSARVATVTPFSNNATICSYPFERWTRGVPGTLGLGALDRLFAKTNAAKCVDLPTAVGFCMLIRRDCLDEIGAFDAERFGRGYGEENDFCMRAGKAGWRNLLAGDVFVFHEGSVSFSEERFALMEAAAPALFSVHPDYPLRVHEFMERDEANALRAAIHRARFEEGGDEARSVLDERIEERDLVTRDLYFVMRKTWDHEEHVKRLEHEIAVAKRALAERDEHLVQAQEIVAGRDEEVARLRAGLSHAESLAFSRMRELDEIRSNWIWRTFNYVMRRRRGNAS
jgi:hypothetical protein